MSKLTTVLRRLAWQGIARLPRWLQLLTGHRILTVQGDPSLSAASSSLVFGESEGRLGENIEIVASAAKALEPTVFPPLRVWRFTVAQLVHNSRFNAIVANHNLVLPLRREAGPWALYKGRNPRRVGLINGQSGSLVAMRRVRPSLRLPEALSVGTRAPYNWYHWIGNVLPALHVANEGGVPRRVPVILPDEIQGFPQMMESLSIFLDGREIVWISRDCMVEADVLHWADGPVYDAPFSQHLTERLPVTLHAEAMAGYRRRILDYYGHPREPREGSQKIFLARSSNAARPYNSDQVEGWARQLGFSLCLIENLSFSDQVGLFQGASQIVGPTGAAWSGIMFAEPDLRALRLHGGAARYENYFSNLATISGAKIFDLAGPKAHFAAGGDGFLVTRDAFYQAIQTIFGAP